MRIEKVGGNRKQVTVSCLRHLCLGEKKKMRFSRREVEFYRLKIRSKTANVAQVNEGKVKGGVKTFGSTPIEQCNLGTFMVPSPEGDFEVVVGVATFLNSK
ncbi:hypothetical protein E2C01_042979 [Portunus trituberculatus]|uniref:Uncharacterized protein n=1 Tax=Portunus trituberculatus TaxID=210409 RepID=A0A5B7FXZ8_PORTR|nr:hypothetical protein [Portunus trituberculatus]